MYVAIDASNGYLDPWLTWIWNVCLSNDGPWSDAPKSRARSGAAKLNVCERSANDDGHVIYTQKNTLCCKINVHSQIFKLRLTEFSCKF